MNFLIKLLVQYPILLFAITIHEYTHGKVAEFFGDDTARVMGRLTLNPLAHIDVVGTLILPMLAMLSGVPFFGWAKPVPINIFVMNRSQIMLVGLSGPLSNFFVAFIFGLIYNLLRIYNFEMYSGDIIFIYGVIVNIGLAIFNLIPIPPLDGSKVLAGILPYEWADYYENFIGRYGFFIILFLLYSGVLGVIISPLMNFFIKILLPNSIVW
ncbi:MAG: site-2 protease family protein [Elusimicrobiota bacterium]|nr:site-2 protease family protein [Endomicrobiia bacterium]MCX7910478.1 site-2 protease family protein [Endomicrobiia bacterium]MDW8165466.1 site-2 protease family protein [Elusimicrobiota bacterium]